MHPIVSIYLTCLIFVIISALCASLKMKRVLMQSPEFAFIVSKIQGGFTVKTIIFFVCPILHLIPLIIYVCLCLMSDETFVKVFKFAVDREEEENLKNEIRQNIKSLEGKGNPNQLTKNMILSYLKQVQVDINDLEDENLTDKFINLVKILILEENRVHAIKNVSLHLYLTNYKFDTDTIFEILYKEINEKDLLIKIKEILKGNTSYFEKEKEE